MSLGRDFWLFRIGQLISLLGDAAGTIALAWWVLDKTGSAVAMSSVLAPAMVAKIFLLPLFGPIADRLPRRRLLVTADVCGALTMGGIAALVHGDSYRLPLVIALYVVSGIGTALFMAASSGIVPQLVPREHLQKAMQQTQAMQSFGSVIGGIVGGIAVTTVGVFGAFAIDAVSFGAAAVFTLMIKADTRPRRAEGAEPPLPSLKNWGRELAQGFTALRAIPVLFWLCMVAMLMNLVMAPMGVALPVLAKEARAMPPWFLGALESAVGLGAIAGAFSIGWLQARVSSALVMIAAIALIGVGVATLPFAPTVFAPVVILFAVGLGSTWANVPLGTQLSLALPDHYRGRVGSIMSFLCSGMAPLGVALSGVLIGHLGLPRSLWLMGCAMVLLTPLMLFIPRFRGFMAASPDEASRFFAKHYPTAFR